MSPAVEFPSPQIASEPRKRKAWYDTPDEFTPPNRITKLSARAGEAQLSYEVSGGERTTLETKTSGRRLKPSGP